MREFSSYIGTLTCIFHGYQFESLYYRFILRFTDKFLKSNKENVNTIMKLSETLHEISWWKNNAYKVFKPVRFLKISVMIYADA